MFLCCVCLQGRASLRGQHGGCTLGREEFLEALLMLYEECASPELMKINHVANFVNKCKYQFYNIMNSVVVCLCPQPYFFQPYCCNLVHSCPKMTISQIYLLCLTFMVFLKSPYYVNCLRYLRLP